MNSTTIANQTVLDRLSRSQIYKDYERAFGEATGLPLTLSPIEDWHLAHHGRHHENPFCALLARLNKTCAVCLQTQQQLANIAREQSQTIRCFTGMNETAIPLRVGDQLVGFLRTGEVMSDAPTPRDFNRVIRQLVKLGAKVDTKKLREAYFRTRVLAPTQYESVLQLLRIFAQHLSIVAHQVVFQAENSEPPNIARARDFITAKHAENLSLTEVARAVHMSVFYFCKQFKKTTGLSFTDYLNRVRIEKARERLLNPHVRVSEVAYEVGFQSLTHFNRVFRKLHGESPTEYRAALPLAKAA